MNLPGFDVGGRSRVFSETNPRHSWVTAPTLVVVPLSVGRTSMPVRMRSRNSLTWLMSPTVRTQSDRWELRNYAGVVVGTLARKFEPPPDVRCIGATVLAVATWSRERSDPQYRQHLKNDTWEVVIPELIFEPLSPGEP